MQCIFTIFNACACGFVWMGWGLGGVSICRVTKNISCGYVNIGLHIMTYTRHSCNWAVMFFLIPHLLWHPSIVIFKDQWHSIPFRNVWDVSCHNLFNKLCLTWPLINLSACLIEVLCPTWKIFTHMDRSLNWLIKGFKFLPIPGTPGYWTVRIPQCLTPNDDPWNHHLLPCICSGAVTTWLND